MAEATDRRLDSWKEIAEYLGKDVRTAIRWEKERGLPIHRLPGEKRSTVFAHTSEVDRWLASDGQAVDSASQATEFPQTPISADTFLTKRAARRYLFLLGIVAVSGLVVVASVFLLRNQAGAPERFTFAGDKMAAWDLEGKLAWEYQFPYALEEGLAADPAGLVRLADQNRDGRVDRILVAAHYEKNAQAPTAADEVFCFDMEGALLWRYAPALKVTSGGRIYEGSWYISDWELSPRTQNFWIAAHHPLGWPSCLVRLELDGRHSERFTNTGWIMGIGFFENPSGSFVLAGGMSNECDAGVLAIIREDAPESGAPHLPGSERLLANGSDSHPYRYFVFPRSEINLATKSPVNHVSTLHRYGHQIEVRTKEAVVGAEHLAGMGIYVLSKDFEITAVSKSDTYWDAHRRLEKQGLLGHSVEGCPERRMPKPVRVFDAGRGWREVAVSRLRTQQGGR